MHPVLKVTTYQIPHILPLGVVEISVEVLAAWIISVPFYSFFYNLLFQPFHLKTRKAKNCLAL